jgi:mRNA interferase MazF
MGKFVKGEIVTLPFPFSDLGGSKKRPALAVSEAMGNDIILCQVTSSRNDAYCIELRKSDFTTGFLPQDPSYIRPNKIFTADISVIIKSNGVISQAKYSEVRDKIINIVF